MNMDLTELVFILDRSGSMGGLESDTIGGFNGMIDRQKKEEKGVNVTTILFDDEVEVIHDRFPIGIIEPLTEKEYFVRGCTALLDAVGAGIDKMDNVQKHLPEQHRAGKVIFVITTDGLENSSIKTSLKALTDKFAAVPYGFDPKDVQWLVAMLFKQGRISMVLNSQTLSLLSNSHEELVKYITKREYVEKLLIDIRVRATDRQIRSVKEVIKDYFGGSVSSEDDDVLMKAFKNFAKNKKQFFDDIMVEYRINPDLPSKSLMEKAKKNLEVVMNITDSVEFFKTVDEMRDDLLDDAEDTTPVFDFFKGEQKKIFEKTQKYLGIFDKSKTYVRDQKVLDVVAKMTEIVKGRNPYSQIQNLPDLNQQFMDVYAKLLEEEAEEMRPIVEADFKIVRDVLADKTFADQFTSKVNRSFEELLEKLKSSNEIAAVKNIKLESDTLKLRLLDEIEDYERSHQPIEPGGEEHPEEDSGAEGGTGETPMPKPLAAPKKKRKNVSISSVAGARTYSLENEQDIDRFLAEMKAKLMEELEDDTIITLS